MCLIKHFSSEIQRGIYRAGFNTLDNVEEYLRKIDSIGDNTTNNFTGPGVKHQVDYWRGCPQNETEESLILFALYYVV